AALIGAAAREPSAAAAAAVEVAVASDGDESPNSDDDVSQPADVEVRVLGPVEVEGWATPPNRRKLTEVVVYLATHDRAIVTDTLRNAVWVSADDDSYPMFKQAVSRARAALGEDADGGRHLPEAHDGRYRLGPRVGCDWREFQRLTRAARRSPSDDEIDLLRRAVALVRGAPFAEVTPGT